MRHSTIWLIGSLLGAAAIPACGGHAPNDKPPVPVRLQAAEAAAAAGGIRYSATIQPRDQVGLAFKQSGYVREITQVPGIDGRARDLHEGDRVAAGAVLARLRETEFAEQVQQARSSLNEAEATLAHARSDFKRSEALYNSASLTQSDYDAATKSLQVAEARAEGARAQLQIAQTALDDSTLKAPFAGILTSAGLETGQLVSPGVVGFTLADVTTVKAIFGVADTMLPDLRLGSPLAVNTESVPGVDFRGRITRISPSADPKSRVFEVELTIPNRGERLKSGMIAALQIGPEAARAVPASSAPAVRLSAIVRPPADTRGYAVFVVQEEDGKPVARVRKVTLGEALGNSIVVTDGLKLGERVIVTGASLVTDGERVRIVP